MNTRNYALQAIQTKFFGATDYRGSRVIASASKVRKSFPYDHNLSEYENHHNAALTLAESFQWTEFADIATGFISVGVYVHVLVPKSTEHEMLAALEMAEATIERLNRHNSANGTLDVIRKAINKAR